MQHVLHSIYGMTQQFLCQDRPGRPHGDIDKPVEKMEKLIRQNCRDIDLVRPNKTDPHRCIPPEKYKMFAGCDDS